MPAVFRRGSIRPAESVGGELVRPANQSPIDGVLAILKYEIRELSNLLRLGCRAFA
jgi:hypothetical protein